MFKTIKRNINRITWKHYNGRQIWLLKSINVIAQFVRNYFQFGYANTFKYHSFKAILMLSCLIINFFFIKASEQESSEPLHILFEGERNALLGKV